VPIAISAEQRALQASIRDWAERAGTLALVRGLEPVTPPGAPGTAPSAPGTAPSAPGEPGSPRAGAATGVPWAAHWAGLTGLGIFSIALP
jgi:hypothetical protein